MLAFAKWRARYESGMREEFAFAFLSTVHVGMSVDYDGLLVCLGFKCKIEIDAARSKLAAEGGEKKRDIE